MEAEPERLQWELSRMEAIAPNLVWEPGPGAWTGFAPLWPFDREEPRDLEAFTAGRRFRLKVMPTSAHPATAPVLLPLDPEPTLDQCTLHRWHVNGNGSLCLLQNASDWTGEEPCSELVVKAAGWFIEYLLVERGCVEAMTEQGIVSSDALDSLFDICHPADSRDQ